MYRGCPAGTHWGDDPCSQDDASSERQCVFVSCALVVVVCLCVVLRVTCTRLIDRNKHWIMSPIRRCMPSQHKRQVIHSSGAVHARAVTMPCPASAFCAPASVGLFSVRLMSHTCTCVLSWRCYPRTVSFLLLNAVAWRCCPRSPTQPSSSPPWPCMSSRSWHLALGACSLLICSRRPDRDTSASSVYWRAAL